MRSRFVLVSAIALTVTGLTAGPVRVTHAGAMSASASCTGPQQITFSWQWGESSSYPTDRPEWVGYDVLRRPINACGPVERINPEPFPRLHGQSHSHSFVDTPPSTFETYEYQAIPVGSSRDPVHLGVYDCDPPCVKPAWASCPTASAPLTIGVLDDWGWAMAVQPCPGSCYVGFHFGNPIAQELRDQGRLGTIVKMYGRGWCCGVEGAAMDATRWEPGDCGPTPTVRPSWGELKTIYR